MNSFQDSDLPLLEIVIVFGSCDLICITLHLIKIEVLQFLSKLFPRFPLYSTQNYRKIDVNFIKISQTVLEMQPVKVVNMLIS